MLQLDPFGFMIAIVVACLIGLAMGYWAGFLDGRDKTLAKLAEMPIPRTRIAIDADRASDGSHSLTAFVINPVGAPIELCFHGSLAEVLKDRMLKPGDDLTISAPREGS